MKICNTFCQHYLCTHFLAQVNLAICRVASTCTSSLYVAVLIRILFGPFAYYGVIAYHYANRLFTVSFLTMLTFNIVLKTLFILDFKRISLIPERKIMNYFGSTTVLCSIMYLLQEAVVRYLRGLEHFSRWSFNIYLGKVSEVFSQKTNP